MSSVETINASDAVATAPNVAAPRPSLLQRALPALGRRFRLWAARARYGRARFGAGCDIRPGLELRMGAGARVSFGADCVLDRNLVAECAGALEVGDRTIFGHHCTLAARESIIIGPDCLIAEMVSIRDHDHRFDRLDIVTREQGAVCAPVRIGRNVWIAGKVTIVKGVTIGDNAVIGAHAVVTKNIPANAVAVGIPARVIRMRGGDERNGVNGANGNGEN